MKEIAFRTKSSNVMLIFGAIIFALILAISVILKPRGWVIYSVLSVVTVIAFIGGFCYNLNEPNCLIKLYKGLLWIYSERKWNKTRVSDIAEIKYQRTKSGRMILNSGTLKVKLRDTSYTLWNVKDVERVALLLRNIKCDEENDINY